MDVNDIRFNENGLITAIAQDVGTGDVLMLAWMDKEALLKSIETRLVHYHSRSRNSLWLKGATSGHYQHIVSIHADCDNDALLLKVRQEGAACHTGKRSCFDCGILLAGSESSSDSGTDEVKSNDIAKEASAVGSLDIILDELYDLVTNRRQNPKEGSYTCYLFEKGLDKILKKIGEEASEVIIAAKNQNSAEIKYETADLLYHLIVMLVERGITPGEIATELQSRKK